MNKNLMTTICIVVLLSLINFSGNAQWTTTGIDIYNTNTGGVGVGTPEPQTKLQVLGIISSTSTTLGSVAREQAIMQGVANLENYWTRATFSSGLRWNEVNKRWNVVNIGANDMASLMFANNGWIRLINMVSDGTAEKNLTHEQLLSHTKFKIDPSGRTYIGTGLWDETYYSDYRLYVEKGIRTEKVKVDLTNTWADYVFEPEYELMPLEKLAEFVKKEKHLPKVPSEKELQKEGIDLAEMDKIQMEKIEELTLYVLQLQKQNQELQQQMQEQNKKFQEKLLELEQKLNEK